MADNIVISKDSYCDESNPSTNYGNETILQHYNTGSRIVYGFIEPDISSLSDLYDVTDMYLMVYVLSNNTSSTLRYQRPTASWAESTITYNNMPSVFSGYENISLGASETGWQYIDITSFLGLAEDGEIDNYGFRFHRNDIDASYPINIASSDYGSSTYHPRVRVRYLDDDYGGYFDKTMSVYGVSNYTLCPCGNGRIVQGLTEQTGNYTTTLQVRTPWSDTYEDSEFVEVGETLTYSQSITGGTEYFKVKYDSTSYWSEIGYYPILYIEWYRDLGNRYVKTDGDDDDHGLSWDYAFASIEKGFDETPSAGNLYIESGIYSETLANINLPTGNTELNVHPTNESHVSTDSAIIVIGTGTPSSIGALSYNNSITYSNEYSIHFWSNCRASGTDVIHKVDCVLANTDSNTNKCEIRAAVLRQVGTDFNVIGVSEWNNVSLTANENDTVQMIHLGVEANTDDYIALQIHQKDDGYAAARIGMRYIDGGSNTRYYNNSDTDMLYSLTTSNVFGRSGDIALKAHWFD